MSRQFLPARQTQRQARLTVHGSARAGRQHASIDQLQCRVELLGKELGTAAVVGERCNRRQHVLVAALAAEACLHSPDRDRRTGRDK
jgi:hypothetical protein